MKAQGAGQLADGHALRRPRRLTDLQIGGRRAPAFAAGACSLIRFAAAARKASTSGRRRTTRSSPTLGNSLTPVMPSLRRADSWPAGRTPSRSVRDPTALEHRQHAACRSISWKMPQALFRDLVGEPVEIPAAAGRVDHAVQVGLLLKNQDGVAGDAAAEVVRQTGHGSRTAPT